MICYWIGSSFNAIPDEIKGYLSSKFEIVDCGNDFSAITQKNVTFAIFCLKKENESIFNICIQVCKNLDIKLITLISNGHRPSNKQTELIYNQIDINKSNAKKDLSITLKQLFEKPEFNKNLTFETYLKQSLFESGSKIDIYRILDFIDANIEQSIKEADVAKTYGYSAPYFSKIFKKTVGISFRDYVTSKRIKKAKSLLVESPDEKTASIAYQCGYNDVSYFSRIFKKKTGLTPIEYRKSHQH
ncbi:AraC family transcriptional regulator [Vibrio hannami]|uniref:helix-turn-helix domain-containing protein n=1 Tax=Vibrio hannami TaxID=2717094 RepID=UPI00240ED1C4|nr:AraC family transcriptional regulator [Vibrio hannami]MDG3087325.1 AraC family transcriptional regulator [Vibrio hannami]